MQLKIYDKYTPNYVRTCLLSKLEHYHFKNYSCFKSDLRLAFDYYIEKYIFHWLYRQLNVQALSEVMKPQLALNMTLEQERIFHNRPDCLYLIHVLGIAAISIDDFKFTKEGIDIDKVNSEVDWGAGLSTYSSTMTSLSYLAGIVPLDDIVDINKSLLIRIQDKVINTLIKSYQKIPQQSVVVDKESIIEYLDVNKPNNRLILH